MDTTRRSFSVLGSTAAAMMASGLGAARAETTSGSSGSSLPTFTDDMPPGQFAPNAWHQRLKRIMQVNFNERDAEDFDVEAWADYLADCKAQATFLSVTNIVAFYPSGIADYQPSPYLGGRDLFGECARAAHARGIKIMGRLSPDLAIASFAGKHPDWFRRTSEGHLIPTPTLGGMPQAEMQTTVYAPTCQFTSYYSDFVPAIIREVVGRYPIDGIYTNGWPGVSVPKCYCEACKKIGDPNTQLYRDAYLKRAKSLWAGYGKIVSDSDPERIFSGNLGGGFKGGDLDLKDLTGVAAWFIADNQGRGEVGEPAWDAAQQTRIARAIIGDRPVPNSTGAYTISGPSRWRNVTGNPVEIRSRLAQTTAAGGVLYYHWLGAHQGFKEDRRWQGVGREFLAWQGANDRHFHNTRSVTSVALLVAQRSNRLYKAPAGTDALDSVNGMYAILTEARIPFDVVLDSDLAIDSLKRYSVLVLPNVALMSTEQSKQIETYVAQGGSVLATFETGLYDENGNARDDFALASILGTHRAGNRQGWGHAATAQSAAYPGATCVQRIERQHPLVASFNDTNWIQGASWRVPLIEGADPVLTHIAPYPLYPTEAVYSRQPETKEAVALVRERGRSRLVYLAEDVEAEYWRTGAGDLGDLVTNALRWLVQDSNPLQVDGAGLVEAYGWETEPGYAVHLVNFTTPNLRAGLMRQIAGVGDQTVRLVVAEGKVLRNGKLLRSGRELPFVQTGSVVTFTVPQLGEYEVAAFEA